MNRSTLHLVGFVLYCLVSGANSLAPGFGRSSSAKSRKGKLRKTPPYRVDCSVPIEKLIHHLVEVEECEGLQGIDIGFDADTNIRGLFSRENVQKGEYICAVPFVSTVLLDETFYPSSEPNDKTKLAVSGFRNVIRFIELVTKTDNPLETLYRNSLPMSSTDASFSPTPDFWSDDEIRRLEVPSIIRDILDRKNQIRNYLAKDKGYHTESELIHAQWLVRSRSFTILKKAIDLDMVEGLLQRTVMIPFFDLLNHKQSSNANIEVLETKEYESSLYALVATRNIKKGEEITICYGTGDEPSWELYTKYGFWPEGHGKNDRKLIAEVSEPGAWTSSLKKDVEDMKQQSCPIETSIFDFRIRLKKLEHTILLITMS